MTGASEPAGNHGPFDGFRQTVSHSAPVQMVRAGRRRLGKALTHRRRLRTTLIQVVYVIAGIALGLAVPEIDVGTEMNTETTITVMVTAGTGIIGFIGVVYSLLFLVVQFGTTTFTPRLNLFRDSPIVWHAFGFYTGVTVFCFAAGLSVADQDQVTVIVPAVAIVLLLGSLFVFGLLQDTAFNSIQLSSTLKQVAGRGNDIVEAVYPDLFDPDEAPYEPAVQPDVPPIFHEVRWPDSGAILQAIDVPILLRITRQLSTVIRFHIGPGEMLQKGGLVATVPGSLDESVDRSILKALQAGPERTFEQDPQFGMQVLSDIAVRAMSPAINDPNTAVQALDRTEGLLRFLSSRDLNIGEIEDDDGKVRLFLKFPRWDDYVRIALDEIIVYGVGSPQVYQRLDSLLTDLVRDLPAARRPALEMRIQQLASYSRPLG